MTDKSMLEQIAERFELYASDQDAMQSRRSLKGHNPGVDERKVRAEVWRDAAKELRTIGTDNRDAFLNDIRKIWVDGNKTPGADILALFITPPAD